LNQPVHLEREQHEELYLHYNLNFILNCKHVAPDCVTLKCCVGRCMAGVWDIGKKRDVSEWKLLKTTRHQVSRKSVQ
jgi:hypothetical protein